MFEMLAQNVSPANWGMGVNRIGVTISATWLIAWPAVVFILGTIILSCKYVALRRKTGSPQR